MTTLHDINGGKMITESEIPRLSRYATSSKPSRNDLHSRSASFPQRSSKSPFFVRHNPHPKRVMHLKGLLDIPICTVIDSGAHEDPSRFLVRTPAYPSGAMRQFHGLRMPLNSSSFVYCREKALPGIGLVPITQTWREELTKLTQAVGLRKRRRFVNKTDLWLPPKTTQSKDQQIPSRDGRNGTQSATGNEKSNTSVNQKDIKLETKEYAIQQDRPMEHTISDAEQEGWVMETLCNILQTDSITAVQSWLVNAPHREKEIVLDMIRALSTSDNDFRQSYEQMICSPVYEDQLLQHESSLDLDAIKEYNKSRNVEIEINKEVQDEKLDSPTRKEMSKTKRLGTSNSVKSKNEWIASELKPSSLFKTKVDVSDSEIEEIRNKLESRCSPRVFSHQNRTLPSRHSSRGTSQQSVYVPPSQSLEAVAQRPPSHQSIKSQQSVLKSILEYKPEKE
ncbi:uncharacterized protein LOC124453323 isoform X2 [Xenia sp. Carnegie-2017]|uniref:uncharacterized protein LOC124453323 isoform X2 n=1 Tax=Xenia sp. Carnegie-2017 TaxID=2897299 RepID=UPI001F041B82|nr:uncharacterized protein LOC124453323 isoform X2 [Xenia sp. Carnegie-2017]